jgi:hypothetical protein
MPGGGDRQSRMKPVTKRGTAALCGAATSMASVGGRQHDSFRCSPSIVPDRLDVGQRSRCGIDRECPVVDLRRQLWEHGKDSGGADRTLPAAQEMKVCLAQSARGKADAGPGDRSDLNPRDLSGPILASGQKAPSVVQPSYDSCEVRLAPGTPMVPDP